MVKVNEFSKPNYFKYKSILFYAIVFNIWFGVIGANYFIDPYFIYANICIIYALGKYVQMMGILIYVKIRYK
jgi:hypothetical protein